MEAYSEIIDAFKKFNPRAIALFGSYGMGLQDRYTHDVDVVVYVERIPDAKTRKKITSSLSDGSIPTIAFPYDADFFVRKYEFYEIVFKSCSQMESGISKLLEGQSDCESEVAIFVQYAKALYDDGWFGVQKRRLCRYPRKLLEKNLFLHLFSAFRRVHYYDRAFNKRKQPYWAELCINEGVESLIRAVFAANKTYYGKQKWAEVQLKHFTLKPRNFEHRITGIMKSRDIRAYEKLALDVFRMCKKHYPKECADALNLDSKLTEVDDFIESRKTASKQ